MYITQMGEIGYYLRLAIMARLFDLEKRASGVSAGGE
jgi:hypothetical protein